MLHPITKKLYRFTGPIMGLFFSPNGNKDRVIALNEVFLFVGLGKGMTYHFLSSKGELGTTFRRPQYWELVEE